jgi:hypothetical protein
VADRRVIGDFGDDHPAVGVPAEHHRAADDLEVLAHGLRVGTETPELGDVMTRARQAVDRLDVHPSRVEGAHHGLPDPRPAHPPWTSSSVGALRLKTRGLVRD